MNETPSPLTIMATMQIRKMVKNLVCISNCNVKFWYNMKSIAVIVMSNKPAEYVDNRYGNNRNELKLVSLMHQIIGFFVIILSIF